MRLLVDAHALLWWLAQSPALSAHARDALSDVGNQVWLSAATVWEISIIPIPDGPPAPRETGIPDGPPAPPGNGNCSASLREFPIGRRAGGSRAPDDLEEAVRSLMRPLPISLAHGAVAGRLPRHHADPFDRMLVAQAQIEGLTIVTRDREIRRYEAPVLAA